MKEKTGIDESQTDKVQPFRVYFQGKIIWFARTRREAELKLAEEQKRVK